MRTAPASRRRLLAGRPLIEPLLHLVLAPGARVGASQLAGREAEVPAPVSERYTIIDDAVPLEIGETNTPCHPEESFLLAVFRRRQLPDGVIGFVVLTGLYAACHENFFETNSAP